MTTIIPVNGTPGLVNVEGEFIAVKPLCEALGIQAHGQYEKLKGKSWATTQIICAVGADGKTREMFSIHKDNVAMWLANIDENRVKEEVRPTLIAYQKETAQALNEYFTKGVAVRKPKSQLEQLAEAVLLSQQIIEEKDQQIERMKPAVAKHDAFLDSDRQLLISSVAKAYKAKGVHIGRSFSEVLQNLGLIYLASQPESKRKKWRANTEAVRQGLLVEVDRSTNGYTRIDIRVTPKGFFDIYDRLCKMQGVKPYPKAELAEELIQED